MVYIRINIPQEIANDPRKKIADFLKSNYPLQTASSHGVIDTQLADKGANRTQEQWIQYFNQLGKRMISAPDVYRMGQIGTPELLQSIRDDFEKSWLVTSTREAYTPDTLDAKITHNFGSTVSGVKPTEKRILVPIYQKTPLDEVLGKDEGVTYLQTKFDTKDSREKIRKTLVDLSGVLANLIYVWTPDQRSRVAYPERAAGFVFGVDRFLVVGYYWVLVNVGHSRGVDVKSAKPTRKK